MSTKSDKFVTLPNGDVIRARTIKAVRAVDGSPGFIGDADVPPRVLMEYGTGNNQVIICGNSEEAKNVRDGIVSQMQPQKA